MTDIAVRLRDRLLAIRDREAGQGLAEYALLLGLIAIVAIAALMFLGSAISDTLTYDWTEIRDANP